MSGRTLPRELLGSELEALRGTTSTAFVAHDILRIDRNTYRRYETGEIRPPWPTLQLLLTYWQVGGEDRKRLVELWEQANQKAWWSAYRLDGMNKLLGFESQASHIQVYESTLVFGPLQTEPYIRAIMHGMLPPSTDDDAVERRVQLRLERQQRIYSGPDRPQLQVLLDEAVLHRQVGGAEVHAAQLDHLARLDPAWCELRILPFAAGAHPGMTGAYWVLDFPADHPRGPVVYVDGPQRTLCLDDEDSVRKARLEFEHMWAELALSAADSRHTLQQAATTARTP